MRPTPKQREAFARAFYKHAQNKIPACKRLEVRGQAKRWRIIAKLARELAAIGAAA